MHHRINDIVLDFEMFDSCITILLEVTAFLQTMQHASTSSATYMLHLIMVNALDSFPCKVLKNEMLVILIKHGWDHALQQFVGVVDNIENLVIDIDGLADRLLAN